MALHGVQIPTNQQNEIDIVESRVQRIQETVLSLYQLNFQLIGGSDGKPIVMLCKNNKPISPKAGESIEKALHRELWMMPKSVYQSGMAVYRRLKAKTAETE